MMATHERRRATDHMMIPWMNGDSPWWARLALIVLFWLGPTAIMASGFFAMWTGWLPSPITTNTAILTRVESKLDGAILRMSERVTVSDNRDESTLHVLRVICRNTAQDSAQRLQCDEYYSGTPRR